MRGQGSRKERRRRGSVARHHSRDQNAQSFGDDVRRWMPNLHSDAALPAARLLRRRFTPETQSALIHSSRGKSPTEGLQIYPGNQRLLAAESDDCRGGDGDAGEKGGGRGQRFGCGGGGWRRRGYFLVGRRKRPSGRVGWKRQLFDFLRRHPTWELIPKWEPKGAPFVSLRNFLNSLPVPKSGRGKKATF